MEPRYLSIITYAIFVAMAQAKKKNKTTKPEKEQIRCRQQGEQAYRHMLPASEANRSRIDLLQRQPRP